MSCDLLSFLYLCIIEYSKNEYKRQYNYVVICFHFCIFVLLNTASSFFGVSNFEL